MRIALLVASSSLALIAGCRGPEASQANNSQANISAEASPDPTAVGSTVASSTTPVSKQDAAKIMHERHEGMEAIGKANKAIKRTLDSGSPDLAAVRTNASKIAELSQKASFWFPAGTGPDVGKTGAKPEIWQDPKDFGTKLGAFQKAAQAFNTTAAGNDADATKAAFGNLGKACKACHDKYRKEMKH